MKITKKEIILLIILVFAVAMMLLSCTYKACPTYKGRNTSGIYSNTKLPYNKVNR